MQFYVIILTDLFTYSDERGSDLLEENYKHCTMTFTYSEILCKEDPIGFFPILSDY